jgi:Rieske Fe-S protein
MSMNRRAFLRTLISTAVLGSVVLVGIAELFQLGTANNRQPQQTSQSSQVRPSSSTAQSQSSSASTSINTTSTSQQLGTPTGYVLAASLSRLGGKTSEYFNHPKYGNSILLSLSGQWKAFTATCTHQPCTVQYQNSIIQCPCHGATFDPSNGNVTGGPAPIPLTEYSVLVQNGNVYVSD